MLQNGGGGCAVQRDRLFKKQPQAYILLDLSVQYPKKRDTLTQFVFIVGPPSTTLYQNSFNIRSCFRTDRQTEHVFSGECEATWDTNPMLAQCWATLGQQLQLLYNIDPTSHSCLLYWLPRTRVIEPLLVQSWSTVYDACSTLNQQWLNVSCLLGYRLSFLAAATVTCRTIVDPQPRREQNPLTHCNSWSERTRVCTHSWPLHITSEERTDNSVSREPSGIVHA